MEEARKLSPSPTRFPSPEQRKKLAASPPPPRVPRWLILDRIVHRSSRRRCGVVEHDATASALAHDCVGRPVRASLRIADPPAVSRLYLHMTGRPPIKHFQEPKAIAAHRNCILFRLTVPFEDSSRWHQTVSFPDDYFVYSCRSPSSPPSLTRLPTCFHGGTTCPERDKLYQPHRRQQQRAMFEEEIGILSHGGHDGEFRNNFFGHQFIPNKFSSYLADNAITSWELSEMLQKAKQRTVMQKSGLEGQFTNDFVDG